jgi:hypothetical protein
VIFEGLRLDLFCIFLLKLDSGKSAIMITEKTDVLIIASDTTVMFVS